MAFSVEDLLKRVEQRSAYHKGEATKQAENKAANARLAFEEMGMHPAVAAQALSAKGPQASA